MATKKKWSAKVDTDSTHPDEGLFNKSPGTVAKSLASKKVSPKGPGSGMRMLTFYINRAGKNLSQERRDALDKAKTILSRIIADQKEKDGKEKSPARKNRRKEIREEGILKDHLECYKIGTCTKENSKEGCLNSIHSSERGTYVRSSLRQGSYRQWLLFRDRSVHRRSFR
jgi:hypothetical protein